MIRFLSKPTESDKRQIAALPPKDTADGPQWVRVSVYQPGDTAADAEPVEGLELFDMNCPADRQRIHETIEESYRYLRSQGIPFSDCAWFAGVFLIHESRER